MYEEIISKSMFIRRGKKSVCVWGLNNIERKRIWWEWIKGFPRLRNW